MCAIIYILFLMKGEVISMAEFVERKRWLFFGLPFTFTKYTINDEIVTVNTGFLNKQENDCYMYKIKDVRLERSFFERLCKLGTVVCFTGDTTDPQLLIKHIRNSKGVKDFILQQSETERLRHRTLTTMDIGNGGIPADIDGDGVVDYN